MNGLGSHRVLPDFGMRNASYGGGANLLRTMIAGTPLEQKWVLQGRLCGQWAVDLEEKWESTKTARAGRKCAVDLEDVIWVDSEGGNHTA
jgi:hypothetical protein